MNNKVNRIKWPAIKMKWEAKLRSIATFKGIKDFEEWAINQSPPDVSFGMQTDSIDEFIDAFRDQMNDGSEWTSPESFRIQESSLSTGNTEKDRMWNRAVMLRKQIDEAVDNEDYEKAQLLQDTLNVIKKKYDEL